MIPVISLTALQTRAVGHAIESRPTALRSELIYDEKTNNVLLALGDIRADAYSTGLVIAPNGTIINTLPPDRIEDWPS